VSITTNVVGSNPSWRGVHDTTLYNKVCQLLAKGWWFSPVSSTNKNYRHDITERVFKVALKTIPKPQN
jgi:hypothetical protein